MTKADEIDLRIAAAKAKKELLREQKVAEYRANYKHPYAQRKRIDAASSNNPTAVETGSIGQ